MNKTKNTPAHKGHYLPSYLPAFIFVIAVIYMTIAVLVSLGTGATEGYEFTVWTRGEVHYCDQPANTGDQLVPQGCHETNEDFTKNKTRAVKVIFREKERGKQGVK